MLDQTAETETFDQTPDTRHWAVARVFSQRAHRIRARAEGMDCGVSIPTFRRVRYSGGKEDRTTVQLLPGYLFVRLAPDDHYRIVNLDGVYNLLPAAVRGSERLAEEMALLNKAAMGGEFDKLEHAPGVVRKAPRRPRPSKRARKRLRAARGSACQLGV